MDQKIDRKTHSKNDQVSDKCDLTLQIFEPKLWYKIKECEALVPFLSDFMPRELWGQKLWETEASFSQTDGARIHNWSAMHGFNVTTTVLHSRENIFA